MIKNICFSVWGDNPVYVDGLIKNLKLVPTIYDDWTVLVYICSNTLKQNKERLKYYEEYTTFIPVYTQETDFRNAMWRFTPIVENKNIESVLIFRDTDSRLNIREKRAVDEWIGSDYKFHIIRDHPLHISYIMAGMWGCKTPVNQNILRTFEHILQYNRPIKKGVDQMILNQAVYPFIFQNALVHYSNKTDFESYIPGWKGKKVPLEQLIPTDWPHEEFFVGQAFNSEDQPI